MSGDDVPAPSAPPTPGWSGAPDGPAEGAPSPSPAHGGPGIVVRGVTRAFGPVQALAGADLDARAGAVTALVGPNGSGKTTQLLVLAGLLVPDAGDVWVAGHRLRTDAVAARSEVGWMPDAFGTWDSLTAREILTTFAAAYRVPREAVGLRVAELLTLVHLEEYADRPASVLSRGQKQRLGLARALVHDPKVLLLDEPASGLDPRSRVDLRLLVRRLADEGRTVLISSHVLSELEEMADDAVFLSRGRTVSAGPAAAALGARRTWHVRALSGGALRAWLTSVGAPWQPDDDTPEPGTGATPGARPGAAAHRGPGAGSGADHGISPGAGSGADAGANPGTDRGTGPGGVFLQVDGEEGAARLVRDAVAAGVPLVSLAPAGGALEQAYLALDEERR